MSKATQALGVGGSMAKDSITLNLREVDRQVLTEAAQQSGTSLSMYIRELIECRAAEIRESKKEVKPARRT